MSEKGPDKNAATVGAISGSSSMGRDVQPQTKTMVTASSGSANTARSAGSSGVTHEMISARAHELWKKHGGSALDNWLRAEKELRGKSASNS